MTASNTKASKPADKAGAPTDTVPDGTNGEPKAADRKPRSTAVDLSTLEPTPVGPDVFKRTGAGRPKRDNSRAEGWLKDSWAQKDGDKAVIGAARSITIPKDALGSLRSQLSTAGQSLNLGVAMQVDDVAGGKVRVAFAAKVRTKRPRKPKDETPAAKTDEKK